MEPTQTCGSCGHSRLEKDGGLYCFENSPQFFQVYKDGVLSNTAAGWPPVRADLKGCSRFKRSTQKKVLPKD